MENRPSWKPWGATGPLARDIMSGRMNVPESLPPPPKGVKLERELGGGFSARIGMWPLALKVRMSQAHIELKGIFRGKTIALDALAMMTENPMGLNFKFGQEIFLFALPDAEIQVWLKGLILRNLVTAAERDS